MQDETLHKKSIFSIFTECKSALSRVVRSYSKHDNDVDDILQEAFLKTFAASKCSKIDFPKTYLFTTTKNLALRENTKIATKLTEYIEDSGESMLISDDKDAFEILSDDQERAILSDALASLPAQCQQVTRMRLINGYRLKDIAEQLNLSVSTVEKHIAKGLERCDDFVQRAIHEKSTTQTVSMKKHKKSSSQ